MTKRLIERKPFMKAYLLGLAGYLLFLFMVLMPFSIVFADVSRIQYEIVDLGTLGGDTSFAWAVNENGAVSGKSKDADGYMKAFYWDRTNGMVPIGLGKGLGLNDLGQAVGNFHHHNDFAFIWDFASGMVFLDRGDFLFATANAVNNSGMAVGYARKFDDIDGTKAILWDSRAGTLTILEEIESPAYAFGINNSGQVVGNAGLSSRAFFWNAAEGKMDMGSMNDSGWQYFAMDINDISQSVGYAKTEAGNHYPFLWDRIQGMRSLPGDGEALAYSINRHGHIAGAESKLIGLSGKAWLWKGDTRIDLNETIASDSGWDLREARGISDSGYICGSGLVDGKLHAFLLIPVQSVLPDIKANGSDSAISVPAGERVSITVALDYSGLSNIAADWWVVVKTPFEPPSDWYSYVHKKNKWVTGIHPTAEASLFYLPPLEIPVFVPVQGDYIFYFAVDDNPDGIPNIQWLDFVPVTAK